MNIISLPETDFYYLKKDPIKGISVVSLRNFIKGDIISRNYAAIIDWEMDERSQFQQTYPLYWSDEFSCIAFGIINLLNHSFMPNCKIKVDEESQTIFLLCIDRIKPEDELTIYYGDNHYPFKHGNVKIY
jgi:SET domain-containing protein